MNQSECSRSFKFRFMHNINKNVTRTLNGMCVVSYVCTAANDKQFIIVILYNQLGVFSARWQNVTAAEKRGKREYFIYI